MPEGEKIIMEKLREEIIEAEKMRADLIKWKLVIVAVLGAAALGLNPTSCNTIFELLCLIPFVCLYVDLTARHLNLRIDVIAQFLRYNKGECGKYEEFAQTMNDKNVFCLEDVVLQYSTMFLSFAVIAVGIIKHEMLSFFMLAVFIISGVTGIASAYVIARVYRIKKDKITGFFTGSN